jgi:hypothetical protein
MGKIIWVKMIEKVAFDGRQNGTVDKRNRIRRRGG